MKVHINSSPLWRKDLECWEIVESSTGYKKIATEDSDKALAAVDAVLCELLDAGLIHSYYIQRHRTKIKTCK